MSPGPDFRGADRERCVSYFTLRWVQECFVGDGWPWQTTLRCVSEAQAIFCRLRHQPRSPPLQLVIAVPKAKACWPRGKASALVARRGCKGGRRRRPLDDELTTASSKGEKPAARGQQARKSRADDGAGDGRRRV